MWHKCTLEYQAALKGRNPVTRYTTDDPQRQYAKQNKPITKRQMLDDSTYLRCLKGVKIIQTEVER